MARIVKTYGWTWYLEMGKMVSSRPPCRYCHHHNVTFFGLCSLHWLWSGTIEEENIIVVNVLSVTGLASVPYPTEGSIPGMCSCIVYSSRGKYSGNVCLYCLFKFTHTPKVADDGLPSLPVVSLFHQLKLSFPLFFQFRLSICVCLGVLFWFAQCSQARKKRKSQE